MVATFADPDGLLQLMTLWRPPRLTWVSANRRLQGSRPEDVEQ
jgi:hypothetical protein